MTTTVTADLTIDPAFDRGPLDRRIFGSFLEHMGRAVYHGIYEPDHPEADEFGFRSDVQALIEELGTTLVRYPGGNFVSGYDWTHGIGPVADRPRDLELAWHSIETNEVGTDEFLRWAQRSGIEPMLAVNLGTAGIREAVAPIPTASGSGASATRWTAPGRPAT
jgi:alpha-N-arabinofuranosidase